MNVSPLKELDPDFGIPPQFFEILEDVSRQINEADDVSQASVSD